MGTDMCIGNQRRSRGIDKIDSHPSSIFITIKPLKFNDMFVYLSMNSTLLLDKYLLINFGEFIPLPSYANNNFNCCSIAYSNSVVFATFVSVGVVGIAFSLC